MKVSELIKFISFLIVIVAGIPIVPYINPIFVAITILCFLISLKFEFEKRFLLNVIGVGVIIFTIFRLSEKNLIIPIVEAIFLLISIKFLEKKKYRDYMQIYLLSLFISAAYTLLTVKIYFIIYLSLLLILLTISGIILTYYDENEKIILSKKAFEHISLTSIYIFILSLPVAIIIFIILPRVKSPLFDFLNQEKVALTGFSDKMTLGDVKEIKVDNSVIFRVSSKKLNKENLYWRGTIFDYFNGESWRCSKNLNESIKDLKINGNFLKQTFYLEPYYGRYLFALDKPVYFFTKKNIKFNGLIYTKSKKVIEKRIKYTVFSIVSDSAFEKNIPFEKYLQLPENISKKIKLLSKKLKLKTEKETLQNIIKFFKNEKFKYELKNLPITRHPVEDFLFKYKYGNCEYFASSFAILLRLCGIPSRIVAGYRGGLYSDIGHYYIIRQKDAHVWVEAYINHYWIRIDPVNFIPAPLSVTKNQKSKRFQKESLKLKLKLYLDLINYYWIKFVINYNFDKQIKLFINASQINFYNLIKFSLIIMIIPVILFLLIKNLQTKEQILIKTFHKKLRKHINFEITNKTLREITSMIHEEKIKKIAIEFVENFEKIYFKDKKFTSIEYYRLKKILNKLDKLK